MTKNRRKKSQIKRCNIKNLSEFKKFAVKEWKVI